MARTASRLLFLAAALGGLFGTAAPSEAHEGPPYAVTEKAKAGRYELSIWVDPDVDDEGNLWVVVSPAHAAGVSATTLTATFFQDAASAPARVATGRFEPMGGVAGDRFVFDGPFHREGRWNVRLVIAGAQGAADYAFTADVLPEGPQPDQIPFFLIPFAVLAVLAGVVFLRRKKKAPK